LSATELSFAADHPAARGHFPGNPVIPGALLLSEALLAIAESEGLDASSWTLRLAKFFGPARPGDRVRVEHSRNADGSIEFRCVIAGSIVLAGKASCGVLSGGD
jgi:3-hydroxymyristoyl/3-hydroxydecanoyl-(acyl carrier protein) dehydratase